MAKKLTQAERLDNLSSQMEALLASNEKLSKLVVPKKIHDITQHDDYVPSASAYTDLVATLHIVIGEYGGSCAAFEQISALREVADYLMVNGFISEE